MNILYNYNIIYVDDPDCFIAIQRDSLVGTHKLVHNLSLDCTIIMKIQNIVCDLRNLLIYK